LVAGRNRVPIPAAGITAFFTCIDDHNSFVPERPRCNEFLTLALFYISIANPFPERIKEPMLLFFMGLFFLTQFTKTSGDPILAVI